MSSAVEFNQMFNVRVDTPEGRTKAAALGGAWIRDRIREAAFSDQIVPPKPVTRADCQVSTQHDTLSHIVEIEPDSRAAVLTFRGQPEATFLEGKRLEAAFFTISTQLGMKTEQELLAYTMPITKIFEDNSVKDMSDVKDREWIQNVEAGIQALQAEANGVGAAPVLNATAINGATPPVEFSARKGELARAMATDTAVVQPLQRGDLVELIKLFPRNRLRMAQILFNDMDHADILQWTMEDAGSQMQSETMVKGFTANTLLGFKYVRSIKSDVIRPGNVYGFTAPEWLGKSFILNSTRFWIDKIANTIFFQAWEDVAGLIANIASAKKIELYSGDATANDTDSVLASVTPVAESALGAANNRVEQGLFFPQVTSY